MLRNTAGSTAVDFAPYADAVLLAAYGRINAEKFPENFAAAGAEIQRRGLPLPDLSLRAEEGEMDFWDALGWYESVVTILPGG